MEQVAAFKRRVAECGLGAFLTMVAWGCRVLLNGNNKLNLTSVRKRFRNNSKTRGKSLMMLHWDVLGPQDGLEQDEATERARPRELSEDKARSAEAVTHAEDVALALDHVDDLDRRKFLMKRVQ